MRPLAIFNGIILGTCAAIALGLGVTLFIYYLLLDDYPQRLSAEMGPLLRYTGIFAGVTAVAAAAFAGQLFNKVWKWPAEVVLVLVLAGVSMYFLGITA